jgi:hypothetical protein
LRFYQSLFSRFDRVSKGLEVGDIAARRAKIIAKYGVWTAHDVALADGISTMDKGLYQQ